MFLLSSGNLCEVTGLIPANIDDWTNKGIIKPHRGGKGQGNPRLWSPMQAVGILVANEIRNSKRSCVLKYFGQVVEAFATVDEEWLGEKFDEGSTHFVILHQGRPLLDGNKYGDWVNVEKQLRKVQQFVSKLTESN